MQAQFPIWAIDKRFVFRLKLSQGLYYISVNSKGSGETALMRRLARAFAGRQFGNEGPFSHVLV